MEADENKHMIDRFIKQKMKANCTLNLVPAHKMASMIDKYVSSNDSHALETFFDHEVFRKSYHEIRRSIIDQKINYAISEEFEHQLREKVRGYLSVTFGASHDDDDEMDEAAIS